MRNTLSNSNSQTRRASSARSFGRKCLTAKFFVVSGCALAARNIQGRYTWNVIDVAPFCIRAFFSSGYRGFASVLQNPPSRVSDVFHVRPSVRFVTDRLRRLISNLAKGFLHDGLKNSVNRASISFGARTYE